MNLQELLDYLKNGLDKIEKIETELEEIKSTIEVVIKNLDN